MTVVDSDVLIRFLRGQPDAVERLKQAQQDDVLACSVITTFEVLRGCTAQQLAVTEALLSSLIQLPVTEEISRDAAAQYQAFRAQNVTLSMPDLLIGCTARKHWGSASDGECPALSPTRSGGASRIGWREKARDQFPDPGLPYSLAGCGG